MHAAALELIIDEYNQTILQLVVGVDGGIVEIAAEIFVICAGALETPRLLLNSHGRFSVGIGNRHDLVGRNLLDHPVGHYCKLKFRRLTRAPLYASMPLDKHIRIMAGFKLSRALQCTHALPNHYFWLRPNLTGARIDHETLLSLLGVRRTRDLSLRQVGAILGNVDILYRIAIHQFGFTAVYRYADLFFMTEQLPNHNSRVRLSNRSCDRFGYPVAAVDWQLTDADFRKFESYARLVLDQGLCSETYSLACVDEKKSWNRNVTSAAHHLGTARMGNHPTRGVVDQNLRVFGTSNLFICDASVFSDAGSVNPSFTIVALALRLAEHLAARVDSKPAIDLRNAKSC